MLSHSGDWKEEKGLESRARMPYYQDIPFLFQFCAVLSNSFLFLTPPCQEWFIMRTHNSPQKRQFMKLLRVLKSWQLRQPCDIIVLVKAEFPLLV